MKISVSIEFDTWEEYCAFSARMQPEFVAQLDKAGRAKGAVKPSAPEATGENSESEEAQDDFQPGDAIVRKLDALIRAEKPFRTAELLTPTQFKNPTFRARVNKWLKANARLEHSFEKAKGTRGRGTLTFTPMKLGTRKITLPPGKPPAKSDWPIRGAARKRFS